MLRINRHGQPAVGLCGDDGGLFTVKKQLAGGETDIGFVGEIENVDVDVLLHIAEKTVDHHVSKILGKLGVGSRQDAARWKDGEPRRQT